MQKTQKCRWCFNCMKKAPSFNYICLKDVWTESLSYDTICGSDRLNEIADKCKFYDDDEESTKSIDWNGHTQVELTKEREAFAPLVRKLNRLPVANISIEKTPIATLARINGHLYKIGEVKSAE